MKQALSVKIEDNSPTLEQIESLITDYLWPEQDATQIKKRENILLAATKLFVTHGYRKTSIDSVAREAGIAKGTIYLYFRNKAELLLHAITLQKLHYIEELAPAIAPHFSPRDKLRNLIVSSILLANKVPLIAKMTSGDHEITLALNELDIATLAEVNALQIEFLSQQLSNASQGKLDTKDCSARAAMLINLIYAVTNNHFPLPQEFNLNDYAQLIANTVVDGVLV